MHLSHRLFLFCAVPLLLAACGGEPPPFEARYLSANQVQVSYQGKNYLLNRLQQPRTDLPFEYSFEADGDLDLEINGRQYEVDSPYDRDRKKKKVKRRTKKKKTSSKTTSKK
ncbi:hypothetical protein [Desulfogranum mediterraneum]|uniref:hypothetical protein n=1 Tax=Desulfogranum mediterraneum TaxID=160661 RepID=UPI0003F9B8D7|nr:hypothetical protein [Desulfogranum mediterraneum]